MNYLIRLVGFCTMAFIMDSLGAGVFSWQYWAVVACTIAIAMN